MPLPTNRLICIPDITGFTEFMSESNIELSTQVIPSLLNEVIYANGLNLQVSEIEGDAILFFRDGPLPSFEELIDQCKDFYIKFYAHLSKLKNKFKKKEALLSKTLGLKIILHYGKQITAVPIGKNIKLMGEDVIIAHRLLKNKIPVEDYILISEALLSQYKESTIDSNFNWSELHELEDHFEHIGPISYSYINLEPLIASSI